MTAWCARGSVADAHGRSGGPVWRTPSIVVSDATIAAATAHLRLLVPRLRLVHEQRVTCARTIDELMTKLLEARASLTRRDLPALRALGGIAPVTRRSGKQNLKFMRHLAAIALGLIPVAVRRFPDAAAPRDFFQALRRCPRLAVNNNSRWRSASVSGRMHLGAPATEISLVGLRPRRAQLRFSRRSQAMATRFPCQCTLGHLRHA